MLHSSPDAPPLDIYINDQLIFKNINYKEISNYIKIPPGEYKIEMYQAGTKDKAVVNNIFKFNIGNIFTIAAINEFKKVSLIAIPDQRITPVNETALKFVNLSPDSRALDIAVKGGDVIFPNVSLGQITNILNLTPMNIDLEVRIAGSKTKLHEITNLYLEPNKSYTLFLVGFNNEEPLLESLLIIN
jgi:hypothetical protein